MMIHLEYHNNLEYSSPLYFPLSVLWLLGISYIVYVIFSTNQ